jgi:alkylation response protein AidB-like acyl-CoA dehydrogenase
VSNFFRDNADLRAHMAHADWGTILPLLEDDFRRGEEGGPSSLAEALETHDAVLDVVGEIAAEVVAPTAGEVDAEGARLEGGRVVYAKATQAHLAALREAGLFGFRIERRFGGLELPATLYTASVEIVSRGCASLMNLYALQACGETIQEFGSEELKARFLPGIASGETTCCMSLSEPEAGSALGSVSTRAVPVDEERGLFRLHGTKVFSTNGGGDLLLVLARTEEGTTDARGLSLFAVPRSAKVVVSKLEEKLGIHGSPTAVVHLDGADAWIVGQRRRGLVTYVMSLIHGARLEVAAQAVGISQAAVAAAAKYVHERRQFGRPIEAFAPVRQHVLDAEVLVQASRNLLYRAAQVLDRLQGTRKALARRPDDPRAAAWADDAKRLERLENVLTPLVKYWAAEAGVAACHRAIQVHGGYGYVRDYAVERHFRDVRVTSLYEGTSEIQVGGIVGLLAGGGVDEVVEEVRPREGEPADPAMLAAWNAGVDATRKASDWLAERQGEKELLQLRGRPLADMVADVVAGAEFVRDASRRDASEAKRAAATAFLADASLRWPHGLRTVTTGDRTALDGYEALVAPYRERG